MSQRSFSVDCLQRPSHKPHAKAGEQKNTAVLKVKIKKKILFNCLVVPV